MEYFSLKLLKLFSIGYDYYRSGAGFKGIRSLNLEAWSIASYSGAEKALDDFGVDHVEYNQAIAWFFLIFIQGQKLFELFTAAIHTFRIEPTEKYRELEHMPKSFIVLSILCRSLLYAQPFFEAIFCHNCTRAMYRSAAACVSSITWNPTCKPPHNRHQQHPSR